MDQNQKTREVKELQIISGPFAAWAKVSYSYDQGAVIEDIATVFKKFKGQNLLNLTRWLTSKHGECKVEVLEKGTALSGYGSQQGRLFR